MTIMCLLEIDDLNLLVRYPMLADAIYNVFYQHINISRHNSPIFIYILRTMIVFVSINIHEPVSPDYVHVVISG